MKPCIIAHADPGQRSRLTPGTTRWGNSGRIRAPGIQIVRFSLGHHRANAESVGCTSFRLACCDRGRYCGSALSFVLEAAI